MKMFEGNNNYIIQYYILMYNTSKRQQRQLTNPVNGIINVYA